MQKVSIYSTLLFVLLFSFSCSFEDHVLPGEPDVYVSGYEQTDSSYIARYWKNGQAFDLEHSQKPVTTYSIAVSGNDVHVVGYGVDSIGEPAGRYWKNGILSNFLLDAPSRFLNDVEVSGGDVYIAGMGVNGTETYAVYWKNGVSVKLPGANGWARSIAVYGNDVYVAGMTNNGNHAVATYWKNGVPVNITDGTRDAVPNSIAVLNGEVLVVGYENFDGIVYSRYWKNGIEIGITGNKSTSEAFDITTSNNAIYIAGVEDQHAFIWKDFINNLDFGAIATGVKVLEGDVYISGGGYTSNGRALSQYWKNGSRVILSNGKNHAYSTSIFLKKP